MNPTEAGTQFTQSIIVEYGLPDPPANVWRALTEPVLLTAWLMPNDIQAEVGHHFTFHTQPAPGFDGIVHCEILIVEPQRKLSYSWRGGSDQVQGYGHALDTIVTWTLTPAPAGGTHLRLDHGGFTSDDAFAFEVMGHGWRGKIAEAMAHAINDLA